MYIWHNAPNANSLQISKLSSDDSVGTIDTIELYDSGMPVGNLEGIAVVEPAVCSDLEALDSGRRIVFTRDSEAPNLVYFADFSCNSPPVKVGFSLGIWESIVPILLILSIAGFQQRRASGNALSSSQRAAPRRPSG